MAGVTALVLPDVARWQSWAAMIDDFAGVEEMHGSGYWNLAAAPEPTRAGCEAFVTMTELTASADLDGTRVASTYFWITAGEGGADDELVGFLHLRHHLNEFLLEQGVDVAGYLHWSLTDNYEWGSFTPRFGLYALDYTKGTERLVEDHTGDRPAARPAGADVPRPPPGALQPPRVVLSPGPGGPPRKRSSLTALRVRLPLLQHRRALVRQSRLCLPETSSTSGTCLYS